MEIAPVVLARARAAYEHPGEEEPLLAALSVALRELEISREYAVPCLEDAPCRKIFGEDLAQAERTAQSERSLVETRYVTPWRPR